MSVANMTNTKRPPSAIPCVLVAACAVVMYGSVLASTVKSHEALTASRMQTPATEARFAKVTPPTLLASGTASPTALIASR